MDYNFYSPLKNTTIPVVNRDVGGVYFFKTDNGFTLKRVANTIGKEWIDLDIPAQVNLTAGTNIGITGTYPNLTINGPNNNNQLTNGAGYIKMLTSSNHTEDFIMMNVRNINLGTSNPQHVSSGTDNLNLSFSDDPNNKYSATLKTNLLTNVRKFEFPDESGTLALKSDIPSGGGTNIGNTNLNLTGNRTLSGRSSGGGSYYSFHIVDVNGIFIADRYEQGFGIPSAAIGDFVIQGYPSGTKTALRVPSGSSTNLNFPSSSGTLALTTDMVNIGNSNLSLSSNRTLNGVNRSLNLGVIGSELLSFKVVSSGNSIELESAGLTLGKSATSTGILRIGWDNIALVGTPNTQQVQDYAGEIECLQLDSPSISGGGTLVYGTQKYGRISYPFPSSTGSIQINVTYAKAYKVGSSAVLTTDFLGKPFESFYPQYAVRPLNSITDPTMKTGFSILFTTGTIYGEVPEKMFFNYIVNGH